MSKNEKVHDFKTGDEVVVTYVAKVTYVDGEEPMIGVSVPPLDTLWRYPAELRRFPEGFIS